MKHIYKYTIYLFITFLICCTNVYASCTDSELSKFKKVKKDYTVTYEINKETKTYDLYFNAPMPDNFYYQIYADITLNCEIAGDTTMKCFGFPPSNYEILVVGVTNECNDLLKTINLKLPKYNIYADDPLCKGIEEFVLCSPTYDKEIAYEDFVSRINTYKKNHAGETENLGDNGEGEQQEKPNNKNKNELITKILDYIKKYLIEIIIVTIFIILLIITILITAKSIRKSRRLE